MGANAEKASRNDLARVAVMTFTNNSQSENYDWVEKSLPDAINTSMGARFEFILQDTKAVEAIAKPYQKAGGEYTDIDAAKITTASRSDIMIYGNFRLNDKKDALVLRATIFNAQGKRVIGVVEETTSLDAKIFKSIDRLAAGIVEKIYAFALAAEAESGNKKGLKILVLVPQFSNAAEEQAAAKELEVLRDELSESFRGRYLTIYQFYDEFKISPQEQEKAANLARLRDNSGIVAWLGQHGVSNAFVVLVSNNRVNITPVSGGKATAQVAYAVNAKPEEKKQSIAKASERVSQKQEKVELTKGTFEDHSQSMLHIGLSGGKGILDAGSNLGIMTGLSVHYNRKIWKPWLQPQVRLDLYYIFKKDPVDYLLGAALEGGLGYSFLFAGGKMGLTPYAMGGIFGGVVKNTAQQITYYLPVVSGGVTYSVFLTPRWGISVNAHAQYVIDTTASGLFFTGTLSWVLRF
jgi:hypothetical protein